MLKTMENIIKRKNGAVNQIVYAYTVYCNGKHHFYLPICDLTALIHRIIQCNEITKHITFNPFYLFSKGEEKRQIEFDDYMCYIECRENADNDIRRQFINDCMTKYDNCCELKNVEPYEEVVRHIMRFVPM